MSNNHKEDFSDFLFIKLCEFEATTGKKPQKIHLTNDQKMQLISETSDMIRVKECSKDGKDRFHGIEVTVSDIFSISA